MNTPDVHLVLDKQINQFNVFAQEVMGNFERHFSSYSYDKYPAAEYDSFKKTFSSLEEGVEVEAALLWKWGHWGKLNYPAKQGVLISEIATLWTVYLDWARQNAPKPSATFFWWDTRLGRLRYITSAYLTHLIHPSAVPIIDQHNFRAMNYFMGAASPKAKPSNWDDINLLSYFIKTLATATGRSESDIDKYLMMLGRSLKTRKSRRTSEHSKEMA